MNQTNTEWELLLRSGFEEGCRVQLSGERPGSESRKRWVQVQIGCAAIVYVNSGDQADLTETSPGTSMFVGP